MALPYNASQGRVNAIRELARSRVSNPSDSGSDRASVNGFGTFSHATSPSTSSNDTDRRAFPTDTGSQQLPTLPNMTPHNPSRLHSEPEFQINTSALRRAFPDFSQYGSSEDGDSFEIGRAASARHRNPLRRILSSEDPSENISLNIGDERYTVTGTPPMKPRSAFAKRSVSQKENADPMTAQADHGRENHGPGKETELVSSSASSRASLANRKALGELNNSQQPKADLKLSDERPKSANAQSRSSRFSKAHVSNNDTATGTNTQPLDPETVDSMYQSCAVPDMSNITELIAGHNGNAAAGGNTPLFQRTAKPKTRFTTPVSARKASRDWPVIADVPVPEDVRSLRRSLELLQEKVMLLEQEKEDAVQKAGDYELEYMQLKSQYDSRHHSDSGVDVENEEETNSRRFDADRRRLEAHVKALQLKLDKANKKLQDSELQVERLKNDRWVASQQLREAEDESHALRAEEQTVHDEVEQVKQHLNRVHREHKMLISNFAKQEAELRGKIDRRERAVKEMAFLARELWTARQTMASNPATSQPPHRSCSRFQSQQQRYSSQQIPGSHSTPNVASAAHRYTTSVAEPTEATAMTTFEIDDPEYTTEVDMNADASRGINAQLTKEESFMSFMEGDEIAKLNRILEQDRARSAPHLSSNAPFPKDDTLAGLPRQSQYASGPQKPSLKKQPSTSFQAPPANELTATGTQDATRTSMASRHSSRRRWSSGPAVDELTSALILPDITLAGVALGEKGGAHKTKSIKRPIPVSERQVLASADNPDPTIRPSQTPGLALATVLQGLEEELERLRAQFAHQQALYHQHDPALSKRERKSVYSHIQALLATIEVRCDQIYALYDVLEGQKDANQCMDESEVEITLQNLGIKVAVQPLRSQKSAEKLSRRRSNSGASNKQETKPRRKSVVIDVDEDKDDILSNGELPSAEPEYERFQDEFEGFGDTTNTHTQHSVHA